MYTVQADDVGYPITVTVSRSGYSGSITSLPTETVIAFNFINSGTTTIIIASYAGTIGGATIPAPVINQGIKENQNG